MLVFKEVEKCLNDNGFKIVREADQWSSCSEWKIVFESPLIRYGKVILGTFNDKKVVTIDGVQYITSLSFAGEISFDQSDKEIISRGWQRKEYSYFMFFFRRQVRRIKRKIDDCISHLTFLQQRSKVEEVTEKLADMSKDFQ